MGPEGKQAALGFRMNRDTEKIDALKELARIAPYDAMKCRIEVEAKERYGDFGIGGYSRHIHCFLPKNGIVINYNLINGILSGDAVSDPRRPLSLIKESIHFLLGGISKALDHPLVGMVVGPVGAGIYNKSIGYRSQTMLASFKEMKENLETLLKGLKL
jgi:hypothetical protein